jgi:hypothetical protein
MQELAKAAAASIEQKNTATAECQSAKRKSTNLALATMYYYNQIFQATRGQGKKIKTSS